MFHTLSILFQFINSTIIQIFQANQETTLIWVFVDSYLFIFVLFCFCFPFQNIDRECGIKRRTTGKSRLARQVRTFWVTHNGCTMKSVNLFVSLEVSNQKSLCYKPSQKHWIGHNANMALSLILQRACMWDATNSTLIIFFRSCFNSSPTEERERATITGKRKT